VNTGTVFCSKLQLFPPICFPYHLLISFGTK
jgi:hypothetical protein